jgi:predicted DNA-binding transcriptional regulator AlpA
MPAAASTPTTLSTSEPGALISGPKLRKLLSISPVTLWRWRRDKNAGFPVPKEINGRLYFPAAAVAAWLAMQKEAA